MTSNCGVFFDFFHTLSIKRYYMSHALTTAAEIGFSDDDVIRKRSHVQCTGSAAQGSMPSIRAPRKHTDTEQRLPVLPVCV